MGPKDRRVRKIEDIPIEDIPIDFDVGIRLLIYRGGEGGKKKGERGTGTEGGSHEG